MSMARGQHDVALILLRDLAEKLVTPVFIADADGKIVFFNDAAEVIFGRKFSDRAAQVAPEDWTKLLRPVDASDGRALGLDEVPPGVALLKRTPAHRTMRITDRDGVERTVSATALPLLTRGDNFIGVLAVFWEEQEQ